MVAIKNKYHKNLAEYFATTSHFFDGDQQKKPNIRKCMEQPWQQTKAEMWDEVTETLTDLNFIQAKACAKLTYDLAKDYHFALDGLPEYQAEKEKEHNRQERLDKYTRDLIACAEGKISRFDLEVPESITPWTQEQIDVEIDRIKINPNRADKLKDFINFLGQEVDNLQNYASEFVYFTHQQAWNYATEGSVAGAADEFSPQSANLLLRRNPHTRPVWNPLPMVIQILKGHTGEVTAVSITPDGKQAISGSWDGTCILWDLVSGKAIFTLKGTGSVNAVSITPDGKFAVSGFFDNTCILWDLVGGKAIFTLEGHTNIVEAVSITPDGRLAFSCSQDDTCILWNLVAGKAILTLKGNNVNSISITPDGKLAFFGSYGTCILWDLVAGKAIFTLKGHTGWVYAVSITPDGKRALSGSDDNTCILWDLVAGKAIRTLKGHTSAVSSISVTPDCKQAISCSEDNTYILWDLVAGKADLYSERPCLCLCHFNNPGWETGYLGFREQYMHPVGFGWQ